jgi:PAS domain S-box-containing protein
MAQNAHKFFSSSEAGADARVMTALEQAGIVLSTCDRDLRYTWASHPFPGFTIADMLSRRDDELMGLERAAELMQFKQAVLAQGRPATADIVMWLNGGAIVYECRAEPLLDHAGHCSGLTLAMIDVSARREAERQAEQAAERAKVLALATREGLMLHDGERVFEVNEAFCRMFGIDRQVAVGADPLMFIAPESRDFAVGQAARRAHGPDELVGQRYDGTTFPLEVSVERFTYQNRLFRVVQFRDLTSQKDAEVALRESEERYRALAAATREGVVIHDGERIIEVNEIFCALHGTTRERAIGLPAFSFIAPAARETALSVIRSGRPEPYESVAQREDGSTFPVEAAGRPIVYQGRLMRVATLRDLSERHRAEAALRESEERLRGFAEASSDVMWVVDANTGQVEFLSPSYEEMFGDNRDRVLREPERWLKLVHPDDVAGVMAATAATLAGQRVEMEYRIIRPDGAVRWIRDTGFPIHGSDGRIRRAAGLARDVTLRKENEARQRLMLGELNHRVKNTLTTVQSIARQTLRHAPSPAIFQERFEDRLLALSQTHDLLTHENWERGSLRALLKQELAPYGKDRVEFRSDMDVHLAPRAVVPLGMALHELSTNAAKYGALSVPTGSLTVSWSVTGGLFQMLRIEWSERGGPPIAAPPTRQGFGSRLLERGVRAELEGKVTLDFTPEGLDAAIEIPLDAANTPSC